MYNLRHFANRRPLATFFVLAFVVSWAMWMTTIIMDDNPLVIIAYYGGGFGPLIAALLTMKLSGQLVLPWLKSLFRWRTKLRYWAFALLFPALMALMASFLFGTAGGEIEPVAVLDGLSGYVPTLLTMAVIGGGNEEPGWRGFALPRLLLLTTPFKATLLLGIVWALWHLPLIAVRGGGWSAFAMTSQEFMIAAVTLISITTHAFWYTWLWNRTGSVLLCIVLHAGYNTANGLLVFVPEEALSGAQGFKLLLIMTALLIGSVALLIAATGGRLGYRLQPPS